MRSPWKLIKDFASRHKATEASAPADEIVAIPDLRAEEYRQDPTLRTEIEAAIESKSTVYENDARERSDSAGAAAEPPARVDQSDPLVGKLSEASALKVYDQPLPTATVIAGENGAGVPPGGTKKQRAKAARTRENRREQSGVTQAAGEPAAEKKTFLDEAIELELQIKDLRSQLSAKLLEQNAHLRRLLERYDDK